MVVSNRSLLSQGSIFRGYVSFKEDTFSLLPRNVAGTPNRIPDLGQSLPWYFWSAACFMQEIYNSSWKLLATGNFLPWFLRQRLPQPAKSSSLSSPADSNHPILKSKHLANNFRCVLILCFFPSNNDFYESFYGESIDAIWNRWFQRSALGTSSGNVMFWIEESCDVSITQFSILALIKFIVSKRMEQIF